MTYTLKLRHTGSDTKGGGIGPMVTDNLSCTLAAAVQDQTLITGEGREMSDSKPRRELTYATVCSGIECMSVACRGLPMRPVFFSEIEPFPCAVLKAHYPNVPNLGDMSKIQVSNDGKEITNGTTTIRLHERLGILAGGTPCQDVSVAGKRAGMQEGSGTRSSLAFDFVRLARELSPRYVVWENVSGCIDSRNAPDFLAFLRALGDCGYSLAWRVLDAQYVRVDGMERAVPQRRRRVWVVGCLGADESVPAQVLFEPDCVAGHTPPRRRAGQGFACTLAGRDRVDAGLVGDAPRVDCLNFQGSKSNNGVDDNLSPTLSRPQGNDCHVVALDGDKLKPREDANGGGNGFGINEEGAGYTLTGVDRHGVAYCADGGNVAATITRQISEQSGQDNRANAVVQCYDMTHADDPGRKVADGISPTLQSRMGTGGNQVPLTVSMAQNTRDEVRIVGGDGQIAGALPAEPGMKQQTYVVSTNSNGEDVAPTISQSEYRMGQNQKDTGGGYVITRMEKEGAEGE